MSVLHSFCPEIITILPSIAPVEAIFHDGVTVVLGRPVVQELFTCSTIQYVLISNELPLRFVGTTQVNILQTLDLTKQRLKATSLHI